MAAQILDGKAFAKQIKTELAQRVTQLKSRGITPSPKRILTLDYATRSQAHLEQKAIKLPH
mgnify:CR=1 FL=1